MNRASRKRVLCLVGLVGLLAIAVSARHLTRWEVPSAPLRLTMLAFILLCPVLLGLAIGVWGGARSGVWGARGVSAAYLGAVVLAWAQDGVFPVGFHLPGVPMPMFVTLTNLGIFLITLYFMQALGGSGGRLGAYLIGEDSVGSPSVAARASRPDAMPLSNPAGQGDST